MFPECVRILLKPSFRGFMLPEILSHFYYWHLLALYKQYEFCTENRFRCSWRLYLPQLITNIETLLQWSLCVIKHRVIKLCEHPPSISKNRFLCSVDTPDGSGLCRDGKCPAGQHGMMFVWHRSGPRRFGISHRGGGGACRPADTPVLVRMQCNRNVWFTHTVHQFLSSC